MSSYDELLSYTKQLERRLAKLERQEVGVSVAGGDHGTLSGLGDDDHSIYLLASSYGGRTAFGTKWTDLTDAGATTLHKHDHGGMDGLGDDDHSIYLLASAATNRATFAANWTDLTDTGATTLHKHDHGGMDGLGDDDHSQYALLAGRSGGQSLSGGTAANDDLTLQGTTNATRTSSYVILQPNGGNVGINTTTPGAALDLSTGALKTIEASVTEAYFENTGVRMKNIYTGGGWARSLLTYEDSAGSDYFGIGAFGTGQTLTWAYIGPAYNSAWVYFRSGNVGIGANNPSEALEVAGSTLLSNGSFYKVKNSSGTSIRIAGMDGSNNVFLGAIDNAGGAVYIREDGSTQVTVTGGDVGIGTTGPGAKLDVYGSSPSAWVHDSGAAGAIGVVQATNTLVSIGASFTASAVPLALLSAGAEKVRITTGGDVGIGTTGPDEKLHVAGGNVLVSNTYYYSAENSSGTNIRLAGMDSSNNVYLGAIDNAGGKVHIREDGSDVITLHAANVGIGTTSPTSSAKLQVEGRVGIKTGVNAISAQLMVYQDNNTAAIAVMDLIQDDVSEEFINFRSADGAGNPTETGAIGSYARKVRVAVNGTFYWLALYN